MNMKINIKTLLSLAAISLPLHASEQGQENIDFSGFITPKFYGFDYFDGAGNDRTQFLERYNYQRGYGDDNRSGIYLDLDFKLVGNNGYRDILVLERQGFGVFNHRNKIKADSDNFGFAGYYNNFRTSTNGLNFLYTPGAGIEGGTDLSYGGAENTNSGYISKFNNDSPGRARYKVDRSTFGASVAFKPQLFGANITGSLDYDGYQRDGNRFATYILGNGDVKGEGNTDGRVLERWRGFDKSIDEEMNRFGYNLSGAIAGYTLAYEGKLEKFDSRSKVYVPGNFRSKIETLDNGTTASGAVLKSSAIGRAIHFTPDTTLISNKVRLFKSYGTTSVAAGYAMSILKQDSFSPEQQVNNFNNNKINTNSGFINVTSNIISAVRLQGFIKYNLREKNSDFPTVGFLDPADGEELAVHINKIQTLTYGFSGTLRPGVWHSSLTLGWKAEDKERDLIWSDIASGGGIQSFESLYKEQTRTDEFYLNWVARPMKGMMLRLTPSYSWANQTGLPTEPEQAISLKTKLSYVFQGGALLSGYYNIDHTKNSNNSFTGINDIQTTQDNDRARQTVNILISKPFGGWINTHAGLTWIQDDFSSNYIRSDRRRYEDIQDVTFFKVDRPNYKMNTFVFNLGGDWVISDALSLNCGYTFTKSSGKVASGTIYQELSANNSIDGEIDSQVHSVSFGVDYIANEIWTLSASYEFEYYKDESFDDLTGSYNTFMISSSFKF
jgi:hypothetical protein